MKVPGLKRIPTHWPSAGQSTTVAAVSGPRSVRKPFPPNCVIAISKLLDGISAFRTLQAKAGSGTIFKVESIAKQGKLVAYEAHVNTNGKKSEVQGGPEGKPLDHEE